MKPGCVNIAHMSDAVVLLMSGGVESAHLLFRLAGEGETVPLYVRAGHRWEDPEEAAARALCKAAGVGDPRVLRTDLAGLYGPHWSRDGRVPDDRSEDRAVGLPGRNAFLLAAASVLCEVEGYSRVVHGTLGINPFPDATLEFFRASEAVLRLSAGRPVTLATPLAGMSKAQVLRDSRGLPLELSFSCIAPEGRLHCGGCNKCGERRRAFADAGLPDPTSYAERRP